MKIVNKIDRQVLAALFAPVGFVVLSLILYQILKVFKITMELYLVLIIPFASLLGSCLGLLAAERLLKLRVVFLHLVLGAVLGYEVGSLIEFGFFHFFKVNFKSEFTYFAVLVVLLCGYLGVLLAMELTKKLNNKKQHA